MKATRILSAAFIAAALVGCSQEEQFDMFQGSQTQFSGSIEQVASRVVLNDDYSMSWEGTEKVSIFPGVTVNNQYQVSSVTGGKASFSFVDYVKADGYSKLTPASNYALYPYADTISIAADGTMTASVPAEFTNYDGMENSIKTALMAAKASDGNLNFKNVQGILRLKLNAVQPFLYGPVQSIRLESATQNLSGKVNITFDGEYPVATWIEGGKVLTIGLSNEYQKDLASVGSYSEFYLPMVPAQFAANDVKLTINFANNSYEVNVPIDFNIERRKIYSLVHTLKGGTNFEGDLEGADEVWDGETVTVPSLVTDTATGEEYYSITKASELAGFAAMVNGTTTLGRSVTTPETMNFKLEGNIDLGNYEWTPIGTSAKPYKGTFDGNNFTIKNLTVTGYNSNVGLFGNTQNGEIKNINFENAKVSGRFNVGVVAGTPYTSKYTNITVTGHVEVDGMAYVGAVGGKNAYANWTNITVNVDKTSYVNANSVEDGKAYRTYVGGVVGFNGEGGHSFTNITSNINVKGSTCDVGGLFGIAHYGNKFENCVCTGNVEIYNAAEEADAQEIGGIAGVWHPGGEDVVMKNCSFTGTLTANNNFVIDTYKFGNLVCAAYNTTGSGKLIVDGFTYGANETSKTPVTTAEELVEALAAGKDVIFLNDITVAASEGGYNKAGILQNKAQTIDGGGHTLTVTGAGATWDCAIYTNGGIIKNITVAGAMRGIFTAGLSSDLKIDNVEFKNVIYTFNSDGDMPANPFGVYVSNSTVNGWTSHSNMHTEVVYTNCSFGEGSGYKYCRPYGKTEFVNCTFCAGFTVDQSKTSDITFTGCTWEK